MVPLSAILQNRVTARPALLGAAFLILVLSAQAQVSYTSMPLDQGFGALDTSAPPIPAQQIIDQFTAKESVFRRAMANYTYERSVKVETIDDDNKVDGQYFQVTDISFDPNGKRFEHVVLAPASSLERVQMSPADFQDIEQRLPFVLTKEDVGQYDLTYLGKQKVDELDTYVFDVKPRVMEKNKRYFQGRIWVEQHDLQIVVTNGKNVPDDTREGARGSVASLYDLSRADRWQVLVSGLHAWRGRPALLGGQRLLESGRPHARDPEVHGLQAIPCQCSGTIRRPGHQPGR